MQAPIPRALSSDKTVKLDILSMYFGMNLRVTK